MPGSSWGSVENKPGYPGWNGSNSSAQPTAYLTGRRNTAHRLPIQGVVFRASFSTGLSGEIGGGRSAARVGKDGAVERGGASSGGCVDAGAESGQADGRGSHGWTGRCKRGRWAGIAGTGERNVEGRPGIGRHVGHHGGHGAVMRAVAAAAGRQTQIVAGRK